MVFMMPNQKCQCTEAVKLYIFTQLMTLWPAPLVSLWRASERAPSKVSKHVSLSFTWI